jgi:hypothetical protein
MEDRMIEEKIVCPQCGEQISVGAKFCLKCGAKLENINPGDVVAEVKVEAKKPKSKKLFIGLAVAASVVLLLSFLAPSIFAMISPDKYVKSIISEAFKTLEKENKKFTEVPNLESIFASSDKNSEKELYLKINSISDSSMSIDTLELEDYGVKFKYQTNKDNEIANLNLALLDGKDDIVDATIYFNKDNIALVAPKLFDNILGIKFNNNEPTENYNEDLDIASEALEALSNLLESSSNVKELYKDIASKYSKKLDKMAIFKKSETTKGVYTATINGDDLGLLAKDFIVELVNDKNFKEYLVTFMQASDSNFSTEDKEYYIESVEDMINSMPEQIDSALENITIEDLIINAEIENNNLISIDMNLDVLSYDKDRVKFKLTMDNIEETNRKGIEFKLKLGADDETVVIGGDYIFVKDDKDIVRDISFNLKESSSETAITYSIISKLKENKKIETNFTFNAIDEYNETIIIQCKTLGSYKNKDRIDYDSIKLSFYSESEYITADIELSGYASKTNIKSIDKVDNKKITFIDEMDEMELEELGEEVFRNLQIIMTDFEGII